MRLPEKTVLPTPCIPGLTSFKGKNAVWACKPAASAKTAGTTKRDTNTILPWVGERCSLGERCSPWLVVGGWWLVFLSPAEACATRPGLLLLFDFYFGYAEVAAEVAQAVQVD